MQYAICIGLFLPLAGFLGIMIFSSIIGRKLAGFIACATVFLSFLCFAGLLYIHDAGPQSVTLFDWIPIDKIDAKFNLQLDSLSLLMTLIITGVGFLIHVYSNGYMDHDADYARYFACMNFFVFVMLLLVLAGNLPLLFVGWEGVGLASYLLIGFWYEKPAAAKAATKAFVVNRIGDWGFLIGLLLAFQMFGTGSIADINQRVGQEFSSGNPVLTLLALLLFIGAVGKSAQLPLYVWLPDAMEGPTPVSALIHAATMVTAGVYLVVRMHPVFLLAPDALLIVGYVGGITSLFAAICALGQTDLKRVLAYSTVSQLGLMFLACGVAAFYSAMFHLMTHAFIKALLFLSAGNVIHMLAGTTELDQMGGLWKKLPKTSIFFLIGVIALSGVPPLAAFFSKDMILEEEYLSGSTILYIMGLAISILTGFYLMRAYCLAFLGPVRFPKFDTLKEAPNVMLVPVALLALLSTVGGFLGLTYHKIPLLEEFLMDDDPTLRDRFIGAFHFNSITLLSIGCALLGVLSSTLIYTRYVDRLGSTLQVFKNSFYVDTIYEKLFVVPLKWVSRLIRDYIEPVLFDGSIRYTEKGVYRTAEGLQRIQSGQIRSYISWMAIGMVVIIIYLIL